MKMVLVFHIFFFCYTHREKMGKYCRKTSSTMKNLPRTSLMRVHTIRAKQRPQPSYGMVKYRWIERKTQISWETSLSRNANTPQKQEEPFRHKWIKSE